jgi:hypothetical protein
VLTFKVVELQGAGDRTKDSVGRPDRVTALESGVPADTDPGESGQFLAA